MRLGLAVCSTAALLAAGCSTSSSIGGLTGPNVSGAPAFVGTDDRPAVVAATPPPPISGGTLIVTHDGAYAVAADPDRDRVSIVGLSDKALLHTVSLTAGDEPGRLAEDSSGLVHVALRRGGAVATIDPVAGTVVRRTSVCGAPRGIAFEAGTKLVHVACAGGELVSFPAAGGDVVRRVELGTDLRDVIVTTSGLVVSRFKSVSLLKLDGDGNVVQTISAQRIGRTLQKLRTIAEPTGGMRTESGPVTEGMDPAVAWRTVPGPDGTVLTLHQYGLAERIDIGHDGLGAAGGPIASQPYGAPPGAMGCGGLVSPAVSTLNTADELWMGAQIAEPVLTVDIAISADGNQVALAHAGTTDPASASFNGLPTDESPGLGRVTVTDKAAMVGGDPMTENCTTPATTINLPGQATAVAFNPRADGYTYGQAWLVAQTREPAQIVIIRNSSDQNPSVVDLGGTSVLDTGHELFHRDSGAGIACAQCHAEGGEDGRVWKFSPEGNRRTQALHVGISGTEPFHWDGDMANLPVLVDEVFVKRMGGPHQTPERLEALKGWLSSLTPPAPIRDASAPEAVRGKELFESANVGCIRCHSGDKHTNNDSVQVGTTDLGHLIQVPSLVGIGYRAPFLHNGCAATLRARFDPACGGGDSHGKTSQLSEAEIGDLVSYLETL